MRFLRHLIARFTGKCCTEGVVCSCDIRTCTCDCDGCWCG